MPMILLVNPDPWIGRSVVGQKAALGSGGDLSANHEKPFLHRIVLVAMLPGDSTSGRTCGMTLEEIPGKRVIHRPHENDLPLAARKGALVRS